MQLFDLLSTLRDRIGSGAPGEATNVEARALELAADAEDGTVTEERLTRTGQRTQQPVVAYLEEDERPQYLLRAGTVLLTDADEEVSREHPTGETVVVVTDARVLFVLGGRVSDNVFEVPLSDVVLAHLDEESMRRHFVLEADREGEEMTFFADVTLESNVESLRECATYVEGARNDTPETSG